MKRIIFSTILTVITVLSFSQTRTSEEVLAAFSPHKLMANHIEYDENTLLGKFGIDYSQHNGFVSKIECFRNDEPFMTYYYNENNQIEKILQKDNVVCQYLYNSKSLLEFVQYLDYLVAITYDKHKQIVSEALLTPGKWDPSSNIVSKDTLSIQRNAFIYHDDWKEYSGEVKDSAYLYEIYGEVQKVRPWVIKSIFVYDYDRKGNMVSKIENTEQKIMYDFLYDKTQLTNQIKYYTKTEFVEGSTFFYENNKLTMVNKGYFKESKKRNPPMISSETNVMTYDSLGYLSAYTNFDGTKFDSCSIQYDSLNRIVKIMNRQDNGNIIPIFQCSYDDHNYVIKQVREGRVYKTQNKYDSKGNWIQQDTPQGTITRKIYYR